MHRAALAALVATAPLQLTGARRARDVLPTIQANANQVPAGKLRSGVLTLRLEAKNGVWYPEAEDGPGVPVQAFGEAGRPLENPGPLIRVPAGTEIHVAVRNGIPGVALVVHGLQRRPATADDSLVVPSGAVREVRFAAGEPGTYFYWGTTTGAPLGERRKADSQLSGAFIVDQAGRPAPRDRVFVIGILLDTVQFVGSAERKEREIATINGRSHPYTEPFTFTVGDTVRWRWINASDRGHPMHLHGFYYRVDGRGDAARDTVYEEGEWRLVVTERMTSGSTMAMTWVPERPGNWIFHCHVLFHIAPNLRLVPPPAVAHAAAMEQMAGLVLALHVRPAPPPGAAPSAAPAVEPRQLRLLVQERPAVYGRDPGFGFVLQEGPAEPALDSVRIPGTPIVLTRGEPVRITVVNRLQEPTAVHWHGIELESYYDGVPGVSGEPGRLMPSIAPGDSFVAAFTPPRAGTFIYHTHIDDVRQIESGLYGPLIVLPPGRTYDSTTDHVLVIGLHEYADTFAVLLDGSTHPAPLEIRSGMPHRFRIVMIPSAGSADVMLFSDSSLVTWRAVAKDGADLPPGQATWRPARQRIAVGETYDFEFTPAAPGDLRLELRDGAMLFVTMPVRVR